LLARKARIALLAWDDKFWVVGPKGQNYIFGPDTRHFWLLARKARITFLGLILNFLPSQATFWTTFWTTFLDERATLNIGPKDPSIIIGPHPRSIVLAKFYPNFWTILTPNFARIFLFLFSIRFKFVIFRVNYFKKKFIIYKKMSVFLFEVKNAIHQNFFFQDKKMVTSVFLNSLLPLTFFFCKKNFASNENKPKSKNRNIPMARNKNMWLSKFAIKKINSQKKSFFTKSKKNMVTWKVTLRIYVQTR